MTTDKPVVFIPYKDDPHLNEYHYRAILTDDENATHYILLYSVGISIYKEPRIRWVLIDTTEYKASEDRIDTVSVVHHTDAYDSMHGILTYVGDVYNTTTKFSDLACNYTENTV